MRAVRFHEHGDPDVLQIDEVDIPDPRPDEIQVEVRASGVNPIDTYFRDGSFEPATLPMTPGVDFAGVVSETGSNATAYDVGDRVFGSGIGGEYDGTAAEYLVAPVDRVAPLPDDVSFEAAGAAGIASITPWRAIVDHAELEPGEYCLVHGGNGGVGHVAVQLAAGLGARVVTTASETYHDRLSELGAHTVFDYERDGLRHAVSNATDGGPDVIVDHMPERYLQFDCDVAASNARVILFRNRHREAEFTDIQSAGTKELQFQAMSALNTPRFAHVLTRIGRLLSDGRLDIAVAETYDFAAAAEAHQRVRNDSFFGKLVLTP